MLIDLDSIVYCLHVVIDKESCHGKITLSDDNNVDHEIDFIIDENFVDTSPI